MILSNYSTEYTCITSVEVDYIVPLHFDALYKVHVRYERSNDGSSPLS